MGMCSLRSPGFCSSAHFHPKPTFFPQFRAVHKSKDFLNLTNQACKSPVIILTFKSEPRHSASRASLVWFRSPAAKGSWTFLNFLNSQIALPPECHAIVRVARRRFGQSRAFPRTCRNRAHACKFLGQLAIPPPKTVFPPGSRACLLTSCSCCMFWSPNCNSATYCWESWVCRS